MAMSAAALGLLRELIERAQVPRDRFLLSEWQSADWQSLTFEGERHQVRLRIAGADAAAAARRLTDGIEDHEFAVPGQIVADISAKIVGDQAPDGSTMVRLEALTISE
jgi:hypothetical protein